ncbi:unnamed protein product [Calypogeia fissa]
MSMCSVPLRVRRSVAASLDGGYDSPCCSSPSRDSSSSQQLLVRRQQFKQQAKKQSSVLQRSITMSGKKLNKVRSIVRHWKKFTKQSSSSRGQSSSRYLSLDGNKSNNRGCLENSKETHKKGETISCFSSSTSASATDSASDSECSPKSVRHLARSAVTDDVPDGCLALFVGRERRRFVIGAHYLEHNLFRGLLERSAAEFGFDQKGGITIACEVVLFEHLLWLIGTDDPSSRHLQVDELLDFYAY